MRLAALLLAALLVGGCRKGPGQERVLIDETINLETGAFAARPFEVAKDSTTKVEYEVIEGRGVDIFLVTESQRTDFESAPTKPWNPSPPSLFRGKAWFYMTNITAGDQLSKHQGGSMALPPGRWAFLVRCMPREKPGRAEVRVKISTP